MNEFQKRCHAFFVASILEAAAKLIKEDPFSQEEIRLLAELAINDLLNDQLKLREPS